LGRATPFRCPLSVRAALEAAEERAVQDAARVRDNVVAPASRRRAR